MKKLVIVCLMLAAAAAYSITLGQIDTFEDGTTMGWQGSFLDPPTNVPTGGPRGADDNYLQVVDAPNLATYCEGIWAGDWTSAGVNVVEVHVKNDGPQSVELRGVWFGTTTNERATSSVALAVPPDGVWRKIAFPCRASDLVVVQGTETVAQILAGTSRFMFRHDPGAPDPRGTPVDATIGLDNIEASNKADYQPTALTPVRGLMTGGLSHLFFSDDVRLEHRPGPILVSSQAPVEFRVSTNVQLASPTAFSFNVECSATSTSIRREIALLNHNTGVFDIVSPYAANTTVDSLVTVSANPALYIHPLSGLIEARIKHKAFGPVLIYPWRSRHDRVFFRLTP
jgi:hypothetical protein